MVKLNDTNEAILAKTMSFGNREKTQMKLSDGVFAFRVMNEVEKNTHSVMMFCRINVQKENEIQRVYGDGDGDIIGILKRKIVWRLID